MRTIFSLSLSSSKNRAALLPGPVVYRALESGARLDQAPTQGPLVGVIEALAGIRLGRRVQKAGHFEILFIEQPARLLDQVTGVAPGVLVDRLGRARLGPEHRGERRAVELLAATSPLLSASSRSFIVPAKTHLICSRFRNPSSSFSVVKCEPLKGLTAIGC